GRSAPLRIITLKNALRCATHLAVLAEPLAKTPKASGFLLVWKDAGLFFPRISQVPLCVQGRGRTTISRFPAPVPPSPSQNQPWRVLIISCQKVWANSHGKHMSLTVGPLGEVD